MCGGGPVSKQLGRDHTCQVSSISEDVLHLVDLSSMSSILIIVLQNVLQFTIFNLRGRKAGKKAQIDLPYLEKLHIHSD